ncbi:glycosyltransferase [uncultured Chryseobacterium sp.]|uniref:glycosyltransferase n=1 Tax=Chryseobacterium sp. sg2396 TaxID=3276280 RepID=UPI0025D4947B|nr:glycosyltransferase [uncultured Chryseobacterium sp.]
MKKASKYIVVHSGARDYYFLAKALYDKNKLQTLITDFALSIAGSNIARFRIPLPKKYFVHFPFYFFLTKIFRLDSDEFFKKKYLKTILKYSSKKNAVIVFSYYAKGIVNILKKNNYDTIVFQIHPETLYVKERLQYANECLKKFENIHFDDIVDNELETLTDGEDMRYDFSSVDNIICASSETKKSLLFAGYTGNIYVLPYYSKFQIKNKDDIYRKKVENFETTSKINIIYVGTISIRKGILHLIDRLISTGFGNCILHICTRHNLNLSILNEYVNDGRIVIHLNKNDEEVQELIINSHYLILPSFVEGFGLSLIEAISLVTPIIATDNTSLTDISKIANVGFLCNDVYQIANLITSSDLSDFESYVGMLDNCLLVSNNMNEEEYVHSIDSILESIENK